MMKYIVPILLVLVICGNGLRAQHVCRWEICEDTNAVLSDGKDCLSAASSADIAGIAGVIWDSSHSPRNIVRNSTDSGKSWRQLYKGASWRDEFTSIAHPDGNRYVVTGDSLYQIIGDNLRHHAYLLLSSDAGVTWHQKFFDTNTTLRCLTMLNANYGVAILGSVGNEYNRLPDSLPAQLLITEDGWQTWSSQTLAPHLRKLFCFAPGVFSGLAYNGDSNHRPTDKFWKSTDAGRSWNDIGTLPFIWDACFINENVGWGAGVAWYRSPSQSLIVHTTDGGVTWTTQVDSNISAAGGSDWLNQIVFGDSLHGFAIGHNILETSDGGRSWRANKPPFDAVKGEDGSMVISQLNGLIMPAPDLAFAGCGAPLLRYEGRKRLAFPLFDTHEYGPVPIEPTNISFRSVKGADLYQVQLAVSPGELGAMFITFDRIVLDTVIRDTTFAFVPGENLNYYARVRAIAEGDTSDWQCNSNQWDASGIYFKSIRFAGAALPPTILLPEEGSHTFEHDVRVVWTSVTGAENYRVTLWQDIGSGPYRDFTTTDTFALLAGLPSPFVYFVGVKAILVDDITDPASRSFFVDESAGVRSGSDVSNAVFPNPASEWIHISLEDPNQSPHFALYDLLGHRYTAEAIREANGCRIDVHSLPTGIYTLAVPGGRSVQRVMINH